MVLILRLNLVLSISSYFQVSSILVDFNSPVVWMVLIFSLSPPNLFSFGKIYNNNWYHRHFYVPQIIPHCGKTLTPFNYCSCYFEANLTRFTLSGSDASFNSSKDSKPFLCSLCQNLMQTHIFSFANFICILSWAKSIWWLVIFFLIINRSSGWDLVVYLYLKISSNFIRLIFLDKFCFVYIPFVRKAKL